LDNKKKNDDQKYLIDDFKSIASKGFTVNISVSIFGIRNLIGKTKKASIILKLTNKTEEKYKIVKSLEHIQPTCNPNCGEIVKFEKVSLPVDPLLWP